MKKRIRNISGSAKLIAGQLVANNGTIDLTHRQIQRYITAAMFTGGVISYVCDVPSQASYGPKTVTSTAYGDASIPATAYTNGTIPKTALATSVNMEMFNGVKASGVVRIAANVVDAETITIGGYVYEFDADSTITEGHVAVDVSGGLTPTNASDVFTLSVNTVNDLYNTGISAIRISANEVLIFADTVGTSTVALSTTMTGVGNTVTAATLTGGSAAGAKKMSYTSRAATATEVGTGNFHVPLDFIATSSIVMVRTAAGAVKAWDGGTTITTPQDATYSYITITNAGNTDWAATDIITVLAFE